MSGVGSGNSFSVPNERTHFVIFSSEIKTPLSRFRRLFEGLDSLRGDISGGAIFALRLVL
jgi:hypothetical protein